MARSSFASTATFMSRSFVFIRTVAPASRHIRQGFSLLMVCPKFHRAVGLWKLHDSSQLPPTRTAHKLAPVQNACCLVQVSKTSLWIGVQDCFDSICTLANASTTWARRRLPKRLQVLSWTLIGVPSPFSWQSIQFKDNKTPHKFRLQP